MPTVPLTTEAFDSMFYNIFDEIALFPAQNCNPSDTLVLSDQLKLFFTLQLLASDNLLLDAGVEHLFEQIPAFSDTLAFGDTIGMSITVLLSAEVGDQLVFIDAVTNYRSTSFSAYIRRYLNDVID